MIDTWSRRALSGFDSAALKTGTSTLTRHLFFLGVTLAATLFTGYHFGTFDQAIHLPFLAKYANPALFPGDPFMDMRFEHYSFFWLLFLPFQRAGGLEIAMLAGHLLFMYCTFWAIWVLTEELFHNTATSFIAVLSMVLPHISFGGFPLIEFSLLNRTAVLPFLLWAIVLGLRRKTIAMFMLLGLLLNFHLISASFVVAMVGVDLVSRRQWKTLLVGGLVFLLFASPILAWRALYRSAPIPLAPDYAWFSSVTDSVLANLFYLFAPQGHILFATISGLASVGLFAIARREVSSEHDRAITCYVIVAMGFVVLQMVSVLYPVTFLMQLQIVRAGIPATIFAYIYFSHYLVTKVNSRLQIATLAISPTPIIPLIAWRLRAKTIMPKRFDVTILIAAAVVFAGVLSGGIVSELWQPGIHPYGAGNDWNDVQRWARANTPLDATFIVPPQKMGPIASDWRAFSQRPTIALISDVLEFAVVPSGSPIWRERFEAVAPGAQARFRGNYFENLQIVKAAYESLTPEQIDAISARYGASYLVSEKPRLYDYPVVYENAEYSVYRIAN